MIWFFKFLVLFFIGLGLMIYRERVQRFTGNIGFAEQYLGQGGTFTFYLLLGAGFIVFSILYASGTVEDVVVNVFGRFFPRPH